MAKFGSDLTRTEGVSEMDEGTARTPAEEIEVTAENPAPKPGIPVVAEVLGYIGGALAVGAIFALVTTFWTQLGVYGRVGIAAAVAAAGLIGGFAMGLAESPAAKRLEQAMLAMGVAGAGAAAGFAAHEIVTRGLRPSIVSNVASDWAWFAGFAVAAVVGGLVYWRRVTILQHVVFGVSVGMTSLLVLPLIPAEGPDWVAGVVLMAVAVVWGFLGLKKILPPENAAVSLASLGMVGGPGIMILAVGTGSGLQHNWAAYLAVVVAAAVLVAGVVWKRVIALGIGAAALVAYTWVAITDVFGQGIASPITLLVGGIVMIVVAVLVVVRGTPKHVETVTEDGPPVVEIPVAAEILGYVGGALTIGAIFMLITSFWQVIGTGGRLGLTALGAVAGYVGGFTIGRLGSKGAKRLEQFLLALGVIATGAFVGLATFEYTSRLYPQVPSLPDRASGWATLAGFLTGAIVGGVVWKIRPTALQQVVFGLSVMSAAGNAFEVIGYSSAAPPFWVAGATWIVAGAVWLALGLLGWLKPVNVALAIGAGTMLIGFPGAAFGPDGNLPFVLWIALATFAVMVAASIALRRSVLLGFGALGVVVFSSMIVNEAFRGSIGAPIALLITGVVFVAMAVLVGVMLPRMRADSEAKHRPEAAVRAS